MYDKLIDAIDSVTWYNDLAPIIVNWKRDNYFDKYKNYSMSWNWDTFNHYDNETRSQLEVIWIICVSLFGDYGTSPRSGWILMENKEQFYKFIDDITKTHREAGEQE